MNNTLENLNNVTSTTNFFRTIIDLLPSTIKAEKIIMVNHIVSSSKDFILTLNNNTPISVLIPKPNSIDTSVEKLIEEDINILHFKRAEINKDPINFFENNIKKLIGNSTFAIMDIGGYFSEFLEFLEDEYRNQILGIIEDTENGHQKYEKSLNKLKQKGKTISYPIVSVARSSLKEVEDYLVGHEVALKLEFFISRLGETILGKKALVLGFGKIGRSTALSLRTKGMYVSVIDVNPARQALALAYGFNYGKKEDLIKKVDCIICATGNKSIGLDDISKMKTNTYIFSVTSGDDEFKNYAKIVYESKYDKETGSLLIGKNNKKIYLANKGNAINFTLTKPTLSIFVQLVQAEMCYSLKILDTFEKNKISSLDNEKKTIIAKCWLDYYSETKELGK